MGVTTMVSMTGGQTSPLERQGSLYNLTLDEVQSHLGGTGKPLTSMNLEEFLKTISSADENLGSLDPSQIFGPSALPGVQKQSSVALNQELGQKTVDDIWREIQQSQGRVMHEEQRVQRQATLGEITLEDFLFRAGALNQNPGQSFAPQSVPSMNMEGLPAAHQDWVQYELGNAAMASSSSAVSHTQLNLTGVYLPGFGGNPLLEVGFVDNPLGMPVDSQGVDRKRTVSDEIRDGAIDRRQKRMIKNRESAARSRARKQAYTCQLEAEVDRLKKVNTRLKNEKELDTTILADPTPTPRYQLRRTSSGPL